LAAPSAATPSGAVVRAQPRPAGGSIAATESAARAALTQVVAPRRSAPVMPMRRGGSVAGLLVPIALLGLGGTAASWFYLMAQNPVMAGITALLSVVGAAFAWLSLRG
jgi:hypothetical protein